MCCPGDLKDEHGKVCEMTNRTSSQAQKPQRSSENGLCPDVPTEPCGHSGASEVVGSKVHDAGIDLWCNAQIKGALINSVSTSAIRNLDKA